MIRRIAYRQAVVVRLYCFFLLLLGTAPASSAREAWFEQISALHGLSHDRITDIHQDRFGYVWVATAHGLNLLDGYGIQTFRYSPNDVHAIKANFINSIHEAPTGDIWLTHAIGGASVLDRSTMRFSYELVDTELGDAATIIIHDLYWAPDGTTWAGTNYGLYKRPAGAESFVREAVDPAISWSEMNPIHFIERLDGTLYLGGHLGLFRYQPGSDKWEQLQYAIAGEKMPINQKVLEFYRDQQDRLWVGTMYQGLFRVEKGQVEHLHTDDTPGAITSIVEDGEGRVWVSKCNKNIYVVEGSKVRAFLPEGYGQCNVCVLSANDRGDIWGLALQGGLYAIHPDEGRISQVNNLYKGRGASTIPASAQGGWEMDRNGNLWVGSFASGLFRQNPAKEVFELHHQFDSHPAYNFVYDVQETRDGIAWIATVDRLWRCDRSSGVMEAVPDINNPYSLMEDRDGNLWIATIDGLEVRDPAQKTVKRYPRVRYDGENKGFLPFHLYQDRDGMVWGLLYERIIRINPETDQVDVVKADPAQVENAYLIGSVHSFYQDRFGTYWAGVVKHGLVKIEIEQDDENGLFLRCTPYMYHNRANKASESMTVNEIYEDKAGRMWIGGYSSGLLEFDRETGAFRSHALPDGRPIPHIQKILEADDGSLWLSSSTGLFHYDPQTGISRQYTYEDGLQSNVFNRHAGCKAASGRMYFGGNRGFNAFMPGKVVPEGASYQPLISQVRVLGKPLKLNVPVEELQRLELDYKQNFLDIDFSAIDFSRAYKLRYSYMLEGIDADWVRAGSRTATYTNLPPGDYTFKVRAAMEGDDWSAAETRLQVSIAPPFWQTTWFFLLVGLGLIGIAICAHLLRVRAKVRQFRAIEAIRKKAAADFHDELGHRLTRISLFTEVLERTYGEQGGDIQNYLEKIRVNSQDLYHSMRNFLWALDPEKDSAYELGILLKDFGDELFDKTGISFNMEELPADLKRLALNMDWKRHLVLIFKEAMHNVLKHADGGNVHLNVDCEGRKLRIELTDDGQGFDLQRSGKGFGIRNMRDRAKKLVGQLRIASIDGKGTRVTFEGEVP